VIVDEAHSSQSGESAMELKGVLNASGVEEEAARYAAEQGLDADDEDADQLAGVVREMLKRGKQPNLSFFAFTATPKYKTKKVFDEPGSDGEAPFHLYTMRQAIEEKFILDVLKNYISYEAYFRWCRWARTTRMWSARRRRAPGADADLPRSQLAQQDRGDGGALSAPTCGTRSVAAPRRWW
jgi:hypothetical protein